MVEPDLAWEITQVAETIDPRSEHYNQRAHLAKTVRFENEQMVWGDLPSDGEKACAHADAKMSCIACHSAWNPSCFGCHLPQRANRKMPQLHNEGDITRNYVSYNFQTLRDDVFMLARDGNATANRIGPARSSCAIHVGSYNANRESIYVQQQTISGDGLSRHRFQHQRAAYRQRRAAGRPRSKQPQNQNGRPPNPAPIFRVIPTPRRAPTAISPRQTTIMRSWPSS